MVEHGSHTFAVISPHIYLLGYACGEWSIMMKIAAMRPPWLYYGNELFQYGEAYFEAARIFGLFS